MIETPFFTQENETLRFVLAYLNKLIYEYSVGSDSLDLHKLYERVGTGSFEMFLQLRPDIKRRSTYFSLKNSPYFGRFDIIEKGRPKKYYMGSNSEYLDSIRILDWRSTLSQIFYEAQTEGYFKVEMSEGISKVPVFHKAHIKIQNSKLEDVIIAFSKDPVDFERDEIIEKFIDSRDIQRKPAKIVSQEEVRSLSTGKYGDSQKDEKTRELTKGIKPVNLIPNRFLTNELQSRGDPKIHTIYRTFQANQYRIVRLPSDQVLVLNGVAGSGKTSIGYHRLAFLAFEERNEVLKPNKMIVFGPNKLFLSYVSKLLPSLQIHGVEETTFEDWALFKLGLYSQDDSGQRIRSLKVTDNASNEFLSQKFSRGMKRNIWKRSSLKGSLKFGLAIKKAVESGIRPCPFSTDIHIPVSVAANNPIISKERLRQLWGKVPGHLPITEQFKILRDSILWTGTISTNSAELNEECKEYIDLQIKDMYNFYPITIYSSILNERFSQSEIFLDFNKSELDILGSYSSDSTTIDLEDLAGILYIKFLIDPSSFYKYDHILIDEGQDFSPIHYVIFREICQNFSMTILGDIAQGIVAHRGLSSWDEIKEIFKIHLENIDVSYRSTAQITNLANEVLPKIQRKKPIPSIPYPRYGKKPSLYTVAKEEDLFHFLAKELNPNRQPKKINSGILTKSEGEAKKVFEFLGEAGLRSNLILNRDEIIDLQKGVTILPINISKGLEFEKVILFNVSKENYDDFVMYDGRLLYVGLTRALHELVIISKGVPSKLLSESNFIDFYKI